MARYHGRSSTSRQSKLNQLVVLRRCCISSWGRPLNIITASNNMPHLLEFHQIMWEFLKRIRVTKDITYIIAEVTQKELVDVSQGSMYLRLIQICNEDMSSKYVVLWWKRRLWMLTKEQLAAPFPCQMPNDTDIWLVPSLCRSLNTDNSKSTHFLQNNLSSFLGGKKSDFCNRTQDKIGGAWLGGAWQILRDTVNEWAVRILLECILVESIFTLLVLKNRR